MQHNMLLARSVCGLKQHGMNGICCAAKATPGKAANRAINIVDTPKTRLVILLMSHPSLSTLPHPRLRGSLSTGSVRTPAGEGPSVGLVILR